MYIAYNLRDMEEEEEKKSSLLKRWRAWRFLIFDFDFGVCV